MKSVPLFLNGTLGSLVDAPGVATLFTTLDVTVHRGGKTLFFHRQKMRVMLVAAADRNGDEASTLRPTIFSLQ